MDGHGTRGGILALVDVIDEHGPALEYDLLTRTRYQLSDIGGALPMTALLHFVQYLGIDSALWREMHEDEARQVAWLDGSMVAPVLADVYDVMALNLWVNANRGARHRRRKPKPYPRPWSASHGETKHFGKDPIPISEFDSWWDSKSRDK